MASTSSLFSIKDSNSSTKNKDRPTKHVDLADAISLIVGNIIGSGIFISPKGVLLHAGSFGYALALWLLAGIITIIGALCSVELGTTYPQSGGTYNYLKQLYGPMPSFILLWSSITVSEPAVIALLSTAFAQNLLQPVFKDCKLPPGAMRLVAACCICVIAAANCYSHRLALRIQRLFASFKILALVVLICLGLWTLGTGYTENLREPFTGQISAEGIAFGLYSGLFAYAGHSAVNDVAGALHKPSRDIPLSILISLPLVMLVYVLVNVAYFTILSYDEIIASDAVAVSFGSYYAPWLAYIIPVWVALSIFGTLNGKIYANAYLIQQSAREGQYPYVGTMVHRVKRTLIPGVIFQCALALTYLNFETYSLISIFSFVAEISTAACIFGLLYRRYKEPELKRTFKNPIIIPMIYILVSLFLIIVPGVTRPYDTLLGLCVLVGAIPIYYIVIWALKIPLFINTSGRINKFIAIILDLAHEDNNVD